MLSRSGLILSRTIIKNIYKKCRELKSVLMVSVDDEFNEILFKIKSNKIKLIKKLNWINSTSNFNDCRTTSPVRPVFNVNDNYQETDSMIIFYQIEDIGTWAWQTNWNWISTNRTPFGHNCPLIKVVYIFYETRKLFRCKGKRRCHLFSR